GGAAFGGASLGFEGPPLLPAGPSGAPGGTVPAVVGPAGAGKTTLVSLIPRFHEPDAGRVVADDTDLATVRVASVRRQVAFVFQEAALFGDTVRENIRFGHPEA